jgi:hypothetical protein
MAPRASGKRQALTPASGLVKVPSSSRALLPDAVLKNRNVPVKSPWPVTVKFIVLK